MGIGGHVGMLCFNKQDKRKGPDVALTLSLGHYKFYACISFFTSLAHNTFRLKKICGRKNHMEPFFLQNAISSLCSSQKLFSPLLAQYIKQNSSFKLPVKEYKLFNVLKKNIGKIVTKDEIFQHVWGEDYTEASDWALNSLIYRLRKNKLTEKLLNKTHPVIASECNSRGNLQRLVEDCHVTSFLAMTTGLFVLLVFLL